MSISACSRSSTLAALKYAANPGKATLSRAKYAYSAWYTYDTLYSMLTCSLSAASQAGVKDKRASESDAALVLSTVASSPWTCFCYWFVFGWFFGWLVVYVCVVVV
jgi:hypothetical protein